MMGAVAHTATVPHLTPFSSGESPMVSFDLAVSKLSTGLQAMVGRGRPLSVELTSQASGIPGKNIENYRAGRATPAYHYTLSLYGALGPAFVNSQLETVGLGGVRRLDASDAPSPGEMLAHMSAEAAILAEMLIDGRLDHVERAQLEKRLRFLISQLEAFHASLETKQ